MLSKKTLWYLKNIVEDKGLVFENKYHLKNCKAPCGRCAFAQEKEYPFQEVWGKLYYCAKWVKPQNNWCEEYVNKKYSSTKEKINNEPKDKSFP